jgi:hypothetical protein
VQKQQPKPASSGQAGKTMQPERTLSQLEEILR